MKKRRVRGRRRRVALGKKGTPVTVPMSYERRLASYGLRDASGPTTRTQTPAQRRRIRHKLGHAQHQAEVEALAKKLLTRKAAA